MDLSYAAIARQANSTTNETLSQGPRAALQILEVIPFFHNEGIMEGIFRNAADNLAYKREDFLQILDKISFLRNEGAMENIFKNASENSETQFEADKEVNDALLSSLLSLRPDGSWESQNFRQGIQTLLSFSFIGQKSSQRYFFMDRLVHLWAYDRLTAAEKFLFGNQARLLLANSIICNYEARDHAFRRNLLPHIATFQRLTDFPTATEDPIGMEQFQLAFVEAGRYNEAEKIGAQRLVLFKGILGEEHPETLRTMAVLASTYCDRGHYRDAEALQRQVLDLRKSVLGKKHLDTLSSMDCLATTYWHQERYKEAEALQVQVLDTWKNELGKDHPITLTRMKNLALTYWSLKRFKDTEALLVQVTDKGKRVLGEEHPYTLDSMIALAGTYVIQGRLSEAEALAIPAVQIDKRVLGEGHPDTLGITQNLACILKFQGRKEEAIALMERSSKLQEQILGPEHPNIKRGFNVLKKWEGGGDEISG
ncbi:MAG: hypothetical protein LQ351_005018 [Letrouitia transgressa]|nr:MAG: hypothetical protein LQ351_005018 [Letrouitia transgressa]